MPLEIPGFYYDRDKKRYFKIERAQTAPTSAAWSSEVVKRRRIESRAQQAVQQRKHLLRGHIKRHGLDEADMAASGLLARELGLGTQGWGGGDDNDDVAAAAWGVGIVDKGEVPFAPSFARARYAHLPCFWVGGDDEKTGLGVAYATLDGETLVGSHIPTDDNGSIRFSRDAPSSSGRSLSFRTEMIRCPQMSSIKYHRPSHRMMLTSREPDHSCGLYLFSPPLSGVDDERPQWLLGETTHYKRLSVRHQGLRAQWLVHQSTPAPAASDLLCVIGTSAGILRVRSNETVTWGRGSPQGGGGGTQQGSAKRGEILDQDFQQGNHNVLLAGGRQPRLWIADLRTPETEWAQVRHASAAAHVRSVNPHQVVVAGPRNTMSLYDLRFLHRGTGTSTRPLLGFPRYRNEAHIHYGWDVAPDLGVVASAQDDGAVRLFSLTSGRALTSSALAGLATDTPVRALMFQRMPRARTPSLFVGLGPSLRQYAFGPANLDEEA